ncbi:carbon-nitrogen hydrolase family protein [Paenibacillus sp. GP183]|uniref:carbon-nitrogen hydrolase family protein n=1 Tax=Paenibacillus sp. GP183 TaxID=1882751 RepID=UPI00089961B7|nr:carbon-nitrogen hydrolase family protein [Paenibacillus sp. GP183]SED06463.1 Predicted amidohydrolase [Paenibacillus sp. GP183]
MKVAVAHVTSNLDKATNLQKAKDYTARAKSLGADLVLFPELYMAPITPDCGVQPSDAAEPLEGAYVTGLREAALANQIYVVCGIYESVSGDENRAYNATVIINKSGELLRTHRKTHLFDAFAFKESDTVAPGENPYQIIDTEIGKIGIMMCYEVRFPEIARELTLQGADILLMPAAWLYGLLKEDHFETLIRARAIENTLYICASALKGSIFSGRSMVVDPMGVVIASAGDEEGLIIAEIDFDRIKRVREKVPTLVNRRPELY